MIKTPKVNAIAGINIDNLRGNAKGVTMQPAGQPMKDAPKPSNKMPAVIKAQAKPMKKGNGPAPKAKVKDPACMVTPYGMTRPAD